MKLIFATQNKEKVAEAKKILAPHGIEVFCHQVSFIEPDCGTVEETARAKLEQVKERGLDYVMVDDAGIYFAAYPDFPGVLSKRIYQRIGYKGIRKLLVKEPREACFKGAVGVCWNGEMKIFCGETKGRIIEEIDENECSFSGFPYDPIFVPEGEVKVLSQLSEEESQVYSYRRKALDRMAEWLKQKTEIRKW
ncbi:non-canonical purine NTP pyrophosphatase [Thermoactinomyces mirandus]|uniref:Non-canonical purine NTP pyrophosphatase n=1 Tax=Thermoactinomyces mirandus TaxID=2756294 RepID=A0A7W1XTY4_9BACL|nr:non-canonical purine NTP pyrophosphatase [Thermoactinomyces mirandus]MBA4603224.1 non-canonical purine NTP pyrophosphatase [Thermoactinomyces mirandus]